MKNESVDVAFVVFSSIFSCTFCLKNELNPSFRSEPEFDGHSTFDHVQTADCFFQVACANFFSKSESEVVWDSRVTYGVVLVCFCFGASSRSTLIFGSLGSLTFNTYKTRAKTPSNIKIIKIWIANLAGPNIDSSNR